ncbi:tetratricopeptide repeat protein [Roseococcus sp. SDR]|uniref:tetratricopeptide repeat protein n=1 Tax=Roseococcus sp. SDR TaxID=2835532 RepID=UPI001BD08B29|nr:tetratricopeptide repeat protein [Roseococcus sp. SDR]MBS7791138.1 tetratricopeptide repeat protein [Roseococcus sp. SDR]MBV1846452.1 tetratricopeptide repeat protein [Roseococcus sp. SDR]
MTTAEELLQRGISRHREGRLDEAVSLYRRALRLAPHHPDAENLLGVAARQKGDLPSALAHAARAVASVPDSPLFLANQGATLAEAGRLAEAIAALSRAVTLNPQDAISLRNLGQALTAAGQPEAALAPLDAATRLHPDAPEPWLALAHAAREANKPDLARAAALRVRGRLAEQAGFLLAALGAAPIPDRAPAAYVRDLFDAFAPRFDAELEGALAYRTPALLAALITDLPPGRTLDLGCGTGLSGLALKPHATRLEGLDLSPRMLAEARARNLYAALHEADLLDFLPKHPARYDLIAAADVLNYLGDLTPAFTAIATALKPGGTALFSLETGTEPVALGEGMRFRHNPDHALTLAAQAGLTLVRREDAVLRQEKGQPVNGILIRAHR